MSQLTNHRKQQQMFLWLFNRNYSRRQASGLPFESILLKWRQVLQVRQFHFVGELPKPQPWNNISMKQATPLRRPRLVNNPGLSKLDVIIRLTKVRRGQPYRTSSPYDQRSGSGCVFLKRHRSGQITTNRKANNNWTNGMLIEEIITPMA